MINVHASAELIMKGKTNINTFECDFHSATSRDFHFQEKDIKDNRIVLEEAELYFDIDSCECSIELISKDLASALNARQFPHIVIDLQEIQLNQSNKLKSMTVSVEMSGESLEYQIIPKKIIRNNEGMLLVKGLLEIDMRDYKIKPPNKMLGLIKVEPLVVVEYVINFNKSNS
ncbi:hypothetical protein [Aureibacter tunicatorum]|uniref:YceI-like domain-containing protein n=1 Tax=Aureibacter tunicatorum TaxID=866807 RepID=A0AAE4BTE8_9BACT|nr:hypothetical protein [Aureibacter tunicatorum]MDR6239860.1 hypothetical protein [Aureibacter tunicatorum]